MKVLYLNSFQTFITKGHNLDFFKPISRFAGNVARAY